MYRTSIPKSKCPNVVGLFIWLINKLPYTTFGLTVGSLGRLSLRINVSRKAEFSCNLDSSQGGCLSHYKQTTVFRKEEILCMVCGHSLTSSDDKKTFRWGNYLIQNTKKTVWLGLQLWKFYHFNCNGWIVLLYSNANEFVKHLWMGRSTEEIYLLKFSWILYVLSRGGRKFL